MLNRGLKQAASRAGGFTAICSQTWTLCGASVGRQFTFLNGKGRGNPTAALEAFALMWTIP